MSLSSNDFAFISKLPGLMIAKDTHSRFLGTTPACANLLGWKTGFDCIGKTDYDIPCNAQKFAHEFI